MKRFFFAGLCLVVSCVLSSANHHRGGHEVDVRIENRTSHNVSLHYRNAQKFYTAPKYFPRVQVLKPGEAVMAPSPIGREWILFDASQTRRAIAYLEVTRWAKKLIATEDDIHSVEGRSYRANFTNGAGCTIDAMLVLGRGELPHTRVLPGRTMKVTDVWAGQTWEFRDAETGRRIMRYVAKGGNANVVIKAPRRGAPDGFYLDNRSGRSLDFWYRVDGVDQRSQGITAGGYGNYALPKGKTREWIVADSQTGRWLKCGKAGTRNQRVVISDRDCTAVSSRAVRYGFDNRAGCNVGLYRVVDGDPLYFGAIAEGRSSWVDTYEGEAWEFRDTGTGKRVGRFSTPSATGRYAIGGRAASEPRRPRFPGRGRPALEIENDRRYPITLYKREDGKLEYVGKLEPRESRSIQARPGSEIVVMNASSDRVLETRKIERRPPVARRVERERELEPVREETRRGRGLGDLLGRIFGGKR